MHDKPEPTTIEIPTIAPHIIVWAFLVKERDNYTCRDCGDRPDDIQKLQAHHLDRDMDLQLIISNGIALCKPCHHKRHLHHNNHIYTVSYMAEILQVPIYKAIALLETQQIKGKQHPNTGRWQATSEALEAFVNGNNQQASKGD